MSIFPSRLPSWNLTTTPPPAPQTQPGLRPSSHQQSRDRPSVFIYLVFSCRNMCPFEYFRWMREGYFLKNCVSLLVFFFLCVCVLLPLCKDLAYLSRGMFPIWALLAWGENEKQMLDPYAGAVSSSWHTNTLPRIRPRVGGGNKSQGGTN